MEFLGQMKGNGCMFIPGKRVEALAKYTRPTTKRSLRSFLGAISFYRRYVDLLASETAILSPSWLPPRYSGPRRSYQPFNSYVSAYAILVF